MSICHDILERIARLEERDIPVRAIHISLREYRDLLRETNHIPISPAGEDGYVGELFGVPLYLYPVDPLLRAAQELINREEVPE